MDAFAEAAASTSESPGGESMLRVVVEGCCHGELDQVRGGPTKALSLNPARPAPCFLALRTSHSTPPPAPS